MAEDTQDAGEHRSPWSRPGFVISAVGLSAVLVAGGILTGANLWDDATDPTEESTPEPEVEAAAGHESVCGLEDAPVDHDPLSEAPSNLGWDMVGRMWAPTHPEAGPGMEDEDGVRLCYARTPLGVLVSAANWWAMGSDTSLGDAVVEQMVAGGPGREAALEGYSGERDEGRRTQIVAFEALEYGPYLASVDLLIHDPETGRHVSHITTHVWENGDWKVALNNDGEHGAPQVVIEDPSRYTFWSPGE